MLLVNRNAYFSYDKESWFGWIPGVDAEDGDIVYPFGKPERGDIVVLDPPPSASVDKPYIKRVIGEPGETVEIRGDHVFINGQQLEEPYLNGTETRCEPSFNVCGPIAIPEDSVLVLGDNRLNSEDSRVFGVVPIDDIIGKTWITYWPRSEIGTVPHFDYPEISN
jgi:signal peptidase I